MNIGHGKIDLIVDQIYALIIDHIPVRVFDPVFPHLVHNTRSAAFPSAKPVNIIQKVLRHPVKGAVADNLRDHAAFGKIYMVFICSDRFQHRPLADSCLGNRGSVYTPVLYPQKLAGNEDRNEQDRSCPAGNRVHMRLPVPRI